MSTAPAASATIPMTPDGTDRPGAAVLGVGARLRATRRHTAGAPAVTVPRHWPAVVVAADATGPTRVEYLPEPAGVLGAALLGEAGPAGVVAPFDAAQLALDEVATARLDGLVAAGALTGAIGAFLPPDGVSDRIRLVAAYPEDTRSEACLDDPLALGRFPLPGDVYLVLTSRGERGFGDRAEVVGLEALVCASEADATTLAAAIARDDAATCYLVPAIVHASATAVHAFPITITVTLDRATDADATLPAEPAA